MKDILSCGNWGRAARHLSTIWKARGLLLGDCEAILRKDTWAAPVKLRKLRRGELRMMPHGGGGVPLGKAPPPPRDPPPPRNEPVLTEYARRSRWRPRQPACQNGEGLLQNAPARLPRPIRPAVPGGDARMGEGIRTFPASVAVDGFPNFGGAPPLPPLPPFATSGGGYSTV